MIKYPLSINNWGKEEVSTAYNILKNGQLTVSKNVENFEKKFAKYHNKKYAVMVNSGSSANLLMFSALKLYKKYDLRDGDEVIVPSLGWSTSYSPIYHNNLKLKLVDVSMSTLNIDIEKLKNKISSNTKIILTINSLGNPSNLIELQKICKKQKIILLEDNCESFGAMTQNKKLTGTFGLMSSFSFYFSHHLTTIEGGMILTDSLALKNILLSIRSHGWSRHLEKINKKFKSFKFIYPGYNVRPIELSAAVGLIQLKKSRNILKIRRQNAEIFKFYFGNSNIFYIPEENGISSWFSFPMILKYPKKIIFNKIINGLIKNNIDCRSIIGGDFLSHRYSYYFDIKKDNYPVSKHIHNYGVMVGNYEKNLEEEIKHLFKILNNIIDL